MGLSNSLIVIRKALAVESGVSEGFGAASFRLGPDLWTQTFITQVHGRKACILFEPDQTPFMYPSATSENILRFQWMLTWT